MLSCDTFALTGSYSEGKYNLLAKNSDRPLGEAQPLVFIKGGDYAPGEELKCTHLTVPQAEHTYDVIGSKPYWIWGFEMGGNEKGVFIGNEAQGSRMPGESEEGLLGMDLLRLALERSASASEAIDVIAYFLEKYGQNANANVRYDRRYENSFMIVDKNEIWLMETAGRLWAAKKVEDWCAISNCYAIETDYDRYSEGMEEYAYKMRWALPGEKVNFAKAFTLEESRQTNSVPRWRRLKKLISACGGPLGQPEIRSIFRDHFEGEINEPRFGAFCADFVTICMHAQTQNASQTAASATFSFDDDLGIVMRYAPSLPCCSVYLPVYWTGKLPAAMQEGGRYYDAASLWWTVEKLATAVGVDEERFGGEVRGQLKEFEAAVDAKTLAAEAEAKKLCLSGEKDKAFELLDKLSEDAVSDLMKLAASLTEDVCAKIKAAGGIYGPRKEFTELYCDWAKMEL